ASALGRSYRILRYDQRGHGGTEATDGKYSFDLLVADVIALLDALSIPRAHFAGISMGGMTALFLAQRHSDRFDRIVACDCGPARGRRPPVQSGAAGPIHARDRRFSARMRAALQTAGRQYTSLAGIEARSPRHVACRADAS